MFKRMVTAGVGAAFLVPGLAWAEEPTPLPQPSSQSSNAVGACVTAGQVWLLVVDQNGDILANQCVGTPTSGEEALWAGGMRTVKTSSGLICSIGGHPERCPDRFEGQYWNYLHLTPGGQWVRADEGATSRRPPAGTVEGWCYNASGTKDCQPPLPLVVTAGQDRTPAGSAAQDLRPVINAPVPPVEIPWGWVAAGAGVAAVAAGALVLRRRRRFAAEVEGT